MDKNKQLNIFYDFEFLEGTQHKYLFGIPLWKTKPTIDMISLGMVVDNGRSTYKEYLISKDFNIDEAWGRFDLIDDDRLGFASSEHVRKIKLYWIRENVLKPICDELEYREFLLDTSHTHTSLTYFKNNLLSHRPSLTKKRCKYLIEKYGNTREEIKTIISNSTSNYDKVSLFGYYCDYDHVLMSWIFGKMVNLPKNFDKFSFDLKQYQNDYLNNFIATNRYFATSSKNKPSLASALSYIKQNTSYPKQNPEEEHHALSDAIWIHKLYTFLSKPLLPFNR